MWLLHELVLWKDEILQPSWHIVTFIGVLWNYTIKLISVSCYKNTARKMRSAAFTITKNNYVFSGSQPCQRVLWFRSLSALLPLPEMNSFIAKLSSFNTSIYRTSKNNEYFYQVPLKLLQLYNSRCSKVHYIFINVILTTALWHRKHCGGEETLLLNSRLWHLQD